MILRQVYYKMYICIERDFFGIENEKILKWNIIIIEK